MLRWLVLALGVAVAACSSGGRIYHADYGRYSASTALAAAPGGELELVVYGSPVAGGQETVEETVAMGLNGTHVDYGTRFVPTDSPDLDGYRTAVVFGATTPEDVCRVRDAVDRTTDGPTPVYAAFCLGDEVLSYTAGSLPPLKNAEDPVLVSYMRHVGYTLFPPENPNYETRRRTAFSW